MPSLLQAAARDALRRRVAALRPDTPARWGRFTAPRMLAHAVQSVHMMTGTIPVEAVRTSRALRSFPLKHLLIHVIPFPKGLPTTPELLARAAVDPADEGAWAAEVAAFGRALDRIPEVERAGRWPAHPAFGPLTGHQWGVLQYRHLDHHFRQFGI